jgi:hypothetical protein
VQTVGVVRREVLAPAVHDCQYIRERNAVLAEAERLTNATLPRPTNPRVLVPWREVWTLRYHATVMALYWRGRDHGEEKPAAPVAG